MVDFYFRSLIYILPQCQAIAAAVLGDSTKVEMLLWDSDRFNELLDGEYDIVFGSDYTASRDVFEVCLFIVLLV